MSGIRPTPSRPAPGQESVWDYPRPPRLEPTPKRIQIVFAGVTIADTARAWRVLETSHPPPRSRYRTFPFVLPFITGDLPHTSTCWPESTCGRSLPERCKPLAHELEEESECVTRLVRQVALLDASLAPVMEMPGEGGNVGMVGGVVVPVNEATTGTLLPMVRIPG